MKKVIMLATALIHTYSVSISTKNIFSKPRELIRLSKAESIAFVGLYYDVKLELDKSSKNREFSNSESLDNFKKKYKRLLCDSLIETFADRFIIDYASAASKSMKHIDNLIFRDTKQLFNQIDFLSNCGYERQKRYLQSEYLHTELQQKEKKQTSQMQALTNLITHIQNTPKFRKNLEVLLSVYHKAVEVLDTLDFNYLKEDYKDSQNTWMWWQCVKSHFKTWGTLPLAALMYGSYLYVSANIKPINAISGLSLCMLMDKLCIGKYITKASNYFSSDKTWTECIIEKYIPPSLCVTLALFGAFKVPRILKHVFWHTGRHISYMNAMARKFRALTDLVLLLKGELYKDKSEPSCFEYKIMLYACIDDNFASIIKTYMSWNVMRGSYKHLLTFISPGYLGKHFYAKDGIILEKMGEMFAQMLSFAYKRSTNTSFA